MYKEKDWEWARNASVKEYSLLKMIGELERLWQAMMGWLRLVTRNISFLGTSGNWEVGKSWFRPKGLAVDTQNVKQVGSWSQEIYITIWWVVNRWYLQCFGLWEGYCCVHDEEINLLCMKTEYFHAFVWVFLLRLQVVNNQFGAVVQNINKYLLENDCLFFHGKIPSSRATLVPFCIMERINYSGTFFFAKTDFRGTLVLTIGPLIESAYLCDLVWLIIKTRSKEFKFEPSSNKVVVFSLAWLKWLGLRILLGSNSIPFNNFGLL